MIVGMGYDFLGKDRTQIFMIAGMVRIFQGRIERGFLGLLDGYDFLGKDGTQIFRIAGMGCGFLVYVLKGITCILSNESWKS
jgi:hypothetical protein